MIIGKVAGTLVATSKDKELTGMKLLVVKEITMDGELTENFIVAADAVGAGYGEVVIVVQGSSARLTPRTKTVPVDALIVAIVDTLEYKDKITYKK